MLDRFGCTQLGYQIWWLARPTPGLAPPATACGATFAAVAPASPVETVPSARLLLRHVGAMDLPPAVPHWHLSTHSCGVCNIIGPHARGRDESKAQAVSGQLILKWALDVTGSSRMAWMYVGNQSESQAPHKPEKQPLCTLIRCLFDACSKPVPIGRKKYRLL